MFWSYGFHCKVFSYFELSVSGQINDNTALVKTNRLSWQNVLSWCPNVPSIKTFLKFSCMFLLAFCPVVSCVERYQKQPLTFVTILYRLSFQQTKTESKSRWNRIRTWLILNMFQCLFPHVYSQASYSASQIHVLLNAGLMLLQSMWSYLRLRGILRKEELQGRKRHLTEVIHSDKQNYKSVAMLHF